MFTRKTTGLLAAGLALVGGAIGAQSVKADEPIVRPAVLTANDNDSTIQLVRHRHGWRRGGWGGYGYYRPYRWGGYYRPYRTYSYWGPGYSYPGYGYGYTYPGYTYYNPGYGVYFY